MASIGIAAIAIQFWMVAQFLLRARLGATSLQTNAGNFGWAYLGGLGAYVIAAYSVLFSPYTALHHAAPYLYYLMHVVPLWILTITHNHDQKIPSKRVLLDPSQLTARYSLTKREDEILQLIVQGDNNSESASKLHISGNTVRNHVYNIYRKADVKNRFQLIQRCTTESA